MSKQYKISLIIPIHNEAKSLDRTIADIEKYIKTLPYVFEIILVNDGSTDNSLEVIKRICSKNKDIKYISFSRNFGKEAATSAGLHESSGDCAIMIDADGQHPIEIISQFIDKWINDQVKVVVGVRTSNTGEGLIKKYGSIVFYKILNSIGSDNTVPGSTDFRLIDRKVIDQFNLLTERGRITRGLIDWMGYKRDYVYFVANERTDGTPSYNYKKLVNLAMHAFISQSTKPLKLVGQLGILITILASLLGIGLLLEMFLLNDPMGLHISGTAFLAIFITFLIGIVLACQGLLALYIESIFKETQNRPLYIIDESTI